MQNDKPFFQQIQEAMNIIIVLNGTFRQNIIEILKSRSESPTNIAVELKAEQCHVSQHLAILRKAGIVSFEQRSKMKYYYLNRKRLTQLEKAVHQFNEAI